MSTETKQYAERDIGSQELCELYAIHIGAMTSEDLDSKSDIAAELAYRDWRISSLEAQLAEKHQLLFNSDRSCNGFFNLAHEYKEKLGKLEAQITDKNQYIENQNAVINEACRKYQLGEAQNKELREKNAVIPIATYGYLKHLVLAVDAAGLAMRLSPAQLEEFLNADKALSGGG
jgi:hypothetical protein